MEERKHPKTFFFFPFCEHIIYKWQFDLVLNHETCVDQIHKQVHLLSAWHDHTHQVLQSTGDIWLAIRTQIKKQESVTVWRCVSAHASLVICTHAKVLLILNTVKVLERQRHACNCTKILVVLVSQSHKGGGCCSSSCLCTKLQPIYTWHNCCYDNTDRDCTGLIR